MSGTVADKKRLLKVTAANLKRGKLSITGNYDFFPARSLRIHLKGLDDTITTHVSHGPNGKPDGYLDGTEWVRRFYEYHKIRTGDILALEKNGNGTYRLYSFEAKPERHGDWHRFVHKPLRGKGPTILELFAGCGGLIQGFKRAGFRTVLANEWDASAAETIRANLTERVAQCAVQEIKKFPSVDVVAGGPPCQGFSNLGERVPCDPRRQLWRHFMRAVGEASPRAFVMENVPPLLSSQEYVEIKKIATELGYNVAGKILNTADYGVPQVRKRTIIIGLQEGTPSFPEPTHVNPAKKDLLNSELPPWQTVRDAIGDLPFEPDGRNWHIGRNPTDKSKKRYRCIPAGGNRWDLPRHLMPDCWKRKTKGGTDLFGRLWWDRPSVTIRTEFYKPEKGRYLHPEAHRPITHREAARLQGFPDDFDFKGSKIKVGIQIGNAVPPLLAEAIAKHVAKLIAVRKPAELVASG